MTKRERKMLGEIQNLVGRAERAYENDRAVERADLVLKPLAEAFQIIVRMRSRYPPD